MKVSNACLQGCNARTRMEANARPIQMSQASTLIFFSTACPQKNSGRLCSSGNVRVTGSKKCCVTQKSNVPLREIHVNTMPATINPNKLAKMKRHEEFSTVHFPAWQSRKRSKLPPYRLRAR